MFLLCHFNLFAIELKLTKEPAMDKNLGYLGNI